MSPAQPSPSQIFDKLKILKGATYFRRDSEIEGYKIFDGEAEITGL